jgi:dipeptidase E
MTKLYLSSYNFGNSPDNLRELASPGSRAAIIMNATDVYSPGLRDSYVRANADVLSGLGIESEELDLRDYFESPNGLDAGLDRFGLIWAVGGNAFVLRRAMRYSGFDVVATPRIISGALVYGGFSAGAIVATPTLRGIELADDPNDVPDGYRPDIIWDGLALFDRSIAPHFRSAHPESAVIDDVVRSFINQRMPFETLRDGEAIVVRDGEVRIVGENDE